MRPNQTIKQHRKRIEKLLDSCYNWQKQSLHLCEKELDWKSVLLSFRDWNTLVRLTISRCSIGDSGIKFLTNLEKSLLNLQELKLGLNRITSTGIKFLLTLGADNLKILELWENTIGDEGMKLIVNGRQLPHLQELNVMDNDLTDAGFRSFPDTGLHRIKKLYLGQNSIGTIGVQLLTKGYLPLLEELSLGECWLDTEAHKRITKGRWPNMNHLNVQEARTNYDAYATIVNNNWGHMKLFICGKRGLAHESDDRISLLNLVTLDWQLNTSILFVPSKDSQIHDNIEMICRKKFHKAFVFEEDEVEDTEEDSDSGDG